MNNSLELEEVWKGVIYQGKDYSDRLEVSNLGNLRNTKTKRVYKLFINKGGYKQICISLGSKENKKVFRVHRCVAESFIPNPDDLPVPNHKDGDKLNNYVQNLEWVSYSENIKHAYDNNLRDIYKVSGANSIFSKLTNDDVLFIRNNYKPKDKEFGVRALARKFNVSHTLIENVVNNVTYKNVA